MYADLYDCVLFGKGICAVKKSNRLQEKNEKRLKVHMYVVHGPYWCIIFESQNKENKAEHYEPKRTQKKMMKQKNKKKYGKETKQNNSMAAASLKNCLRFGFFCVF